MVFGYDNFEGLKEPNDPARSQQFMKFLTSQSFQPVAPTPEQVIDLGITGEFKNLRIFEALLPHGRKLRVSLVWSSLTSSTAKNIGCDHPRQLLCSAQALNFMKKAAAESEVMIYVGHSRGGGGPDTYPPEILTGPNVRSQQVDFSYYRRNRPGLVALRPSFERSETTPSFIVWTGCLSQSSFGPWLISAVGDKNHPTCLVLSTRLTNHIPGAKEFVETDEAVMAAVTMMEALIHRPCLPSFEKRLLDCEIPQLCNTLKPAWKVTMLPGKNPAVEPNSVATGQ